MYKTMINFLNVTINNNDRDKILTMFMIHLETSFSLSTL